MQHLGRQPTEVLHQPNSQHDRNSPHLAHPQGRDRLVGVEEAQQQLGVHAPIGVADQIQGEGVDAGQLGEGAVPQLWQLAIVATRQIVADRPDLIIDHMKIVNQPLSRRTDQLVPPQIFTEMVMRGCDLPSIAFKGNAQRIAAAGPHHHHTVRGSQGSGVGIKLGGAEQIAAQRGERGFDEGDMFGVWT